METLIERLGEEIETRARTFLAMARDREVGLATAESCTGGLLASVLTDVEGCSHVFERGFVTYTDEAKTELLGVPSQLLKEHGAVSRPVAEAMSRGALQRSGASLAAAITGFAGRGGPDDPPGLVFVAVARREGDVACRRLELGDVGRERVRLRAVETALKMMQEALG